MKKKLTGILLAVVMLFTICAGTIAVADGPGSISFRTTTLTGEAFDSSIFQNYDLVMINLWAEWCGPCMRELPDLEQIHQEYPNVLLLGAYCDEAGNAALQAAQQNGVTYPLIWAPYEIYDYIDIDDSGSYGIPQTCFFDRNGNLLGSAYVGGRDYSSWKTIIEQKLVEASGSSVSAQALSFTTTTLTGGNFDSSIFQNYDLVMINLWAEWCGPCMGELPDLEQIHQDYPNVLLLGAYVDRNNSAALTAAQSNGVTYPLIVAPHEIYSFIKRNDSGSYSIPQTCFFDRNGNMLGSAYVGSRTYSVWKAIVEEKLAEAGSSKPVIQANMVGVSLPTEELWRWQRDGECIKEELEAAGYDVDLRFANNQAVEQLAQVEAMINEGCQVLVITAVDAYALDTVLAKAREKGVKVIAYDRLLMDTDAVSYYVTFDQFGVGVLQGNYVKNALKLDSAEGPFNVEFTAGDPRDVTGNMFFNGAMSVLRPYINSGKIVVKSGQTALEEVGTSSWRTEVAQERAVGILVSYYSNYNSTTGLDAWVCVNDSTAAGVIEALELFDYQGKWPVITGQDCDRTNVKYMIVGKQAMSVFKDTRILAKQAAKMASQIMKGETVDVNDTKNWDNNVMIVPTFLCSPDVVTGSNYKEKLIDAGYYTADELETDLPDPPPQPAPEPEPAENLPGDVNEDGEVNGMDVIRLMNYFAGEIDPETGTLWQINENNADVTGDGEVDEKDLLRLVKYLGGENVTLEAGRVSDQ